jgi:hypothetical protein
MELVPAVGQAGSRADLESRGCDTKTIICGVSYTVESLLHPDITETISEENRHCATEKAECLPKWEEKTTAQKTALIETFEIMFWEVFAKDTDGLLTVKILCLPNA